MNLNTLLPLIAVLACPLCMVLMMWMMNKNRTDEGGHSMDANSSKNKRAPNSAAEQLAMLRQEREMLEAEIAETTRLVELEAQRDALLKGPVSVLDDTSASTAQQPASQ